MIPPYLMYSSIPEMPSTRENSLYGIWVVWSIIALSYNAPLVAKTKPSESVPERTIRIPELAKMSARSALPSMKSSSSVISSMNTLHIPCLDSVFKSRFSIARVLPGVIWMNAQDESPSSVMSAMTCLISVVFPVRLNPNRMRMRPSTPFSTYSFSLSKQSRRLHERTGDVKSFSAFPISMVHS